MAKYSHSRQVFRERLNEVDVLLREASRLSRAIPAQNFELVNAMCRGSVVLMCSHIENYIKSVGELLIQNIIARGIKRDKLPSFFYYYLSHQRIKVIKENSDFTKIADGIFDFIENESTHWSKSGPFSNSIDTENFHQGFSNPKFDKIINYFRRFGVLDFRLRFMRDCRELGVVYINTIDHIVDVRNSIAHGDQVSAMTPTEISVLVATAKKFVDSVDRIFCKFCTETYCSIR